jgi:predicted esterase
MAYTNPNFRTIQIDEEDFNLFVDIIEAKITQLKASAEKCVVGGYGSGASLTKAMAHTDKANRLRELISRITTELI